MRKILALAALVLLCSPAVILGQAKGDKKAEQEVLKVLGEWIEALKRNDGPALDRIVSDDFHFVLADGATRSKEEELAPTKAGRIKFEQLSAENVKVFVSGDTAVVTGIGIFKGTANGRPFAGRERFFDVYQKRNGRWQVLASRSTPAQD